MRVVPPTSRVQLRAEGDRLTIEIPSKANVLVIAFLSFWMVGWAMGAVAATTAVFSSEGPGGTFGTVFMIAWLGGWLIGGGFAGLVLAWMIAGREVITLTPSALSIRYQVGALGRTRSYDLAHLSRMRIDQTAFNPFDPTMALAFYGLGGGRVAFDYGSSTIRFANKIDEPDARRIIEACTQVAPSATNAR